MHVETILSDLGLVWIWLHYMREDIWLGLLIKHFYLTSFRWMGSCFWWRFWNDPEFSAFQWGSVPQFMCHSCFSPLLVSICHFILMLVNHARGKTGNWILVLNFCHNLMVIPFVDFSAYSFTSPLCSHYNFAKSSGSPSGSLLRRQYESEHSNQYKEGMQLNGNSMHLLPSVFRSIAEMLALNWE